MKTLAFMQTHIINDGVISELKKLKAAQNQHLEVAVFLDNSQFALKDKGKIPMQEVLLGGEKFKVLFCYEDTLRAFKLPFNANFEQNVSMAKSLWHNGNYSFYIMRHYFADFDFYWHFDYDVFYNDKDYTSFFECYKDDTTDLIVSNFHKLPPKSDWPWINGTEWLYKQDELCACFYPAPRMSARLVDMLYQKRLKHAKMFAKPSIQRKRWANNELFTATECVKMGFSASTLKNHDKMNLDEIDLNTTRLFEKPDKCLYHPVKGEFLKRLEIASGKDEIESLKKLEHFNGFVKFYTRKQFSKLALKWAKICTFLKGVKTIYQK